MHQAAVNLRFFLIRWAVFCSCSVFLLANFMLKGSASTNQSLGESQRMAVINENTAQVHSTLASDAKAKRSILPPFESELDIAAEESKKNSSRIILSNSSAGNTYYRGYCTWYAKFKRPDLPNSLGNAITWFSRAQALGLPTGLEPREGAIGQQGNHVVYVEKINDDGTVTVSEMNYRGFGIVSSRNVPSGTFRYIY